MVLLYWGWVFFFLVLGGRHVGLGVCALGGAGTPNAALLKLKLGLQPPSGPTEVTQGARGLY